MKCFIIDFKKIELVGIKARFYRIPRTFQLRQRQISVSLPMGQGQNSAREVLRTAARPRTAIAHESMARRVVRSRGSAPGSSAQPQNAAVALQSSCPGPATQRETAIFVLPPPVALPDPEGFYASLVLRKVRAVLRSRSEVSKTDGSLRKRNAIDRPPAARISSDVARCEAVAEPSETLLAEMARRYLQTPVFGGRSS
jgi:hypothetical protein